MSLFVCFQLDFFCAIPLQNEFCDLYRSLFPVLFFLAVDGDEVPRQLFSPLTLQLARWFSRNQKYEHKVKEFENLLSDYFPSFFLFVCLDCGDRAKRLRKSVLCEFFRE